MLVEESDEYGANQNLFHNGRMADASGVRHPGRHENDRD
jgi:hypothetical protein